MYKKGKYLVKTLIIAYSILIIFSIKAATASTMEVITYSTSFTNELLDLPAGLKLTISIVPSASGTVSFSGANSGSESFSGLGSDTRTTILGNVGSSTVNENYTLEVVGSAPLIPVVTQTYSATADPWSFDSPEEGSIGTLSVTSTVSDISVAGHSDNISVSVSGLSATITTTEPIKVGDSVTASVSAIWTVTSSMSVAPPPKIGDVEVSANVGSATFTISGPESRSGSGIYEKWEGLLAGEYTVTFHDVTGYYTPEAQTVTLVNGGTISFNGNYIQQVGTINVNANIAAASFNLTGPEDRTGNGMSVTWNNMPIGEYTITFNHADGYVTPESQSKTLGIGDTITFSAEYPVATTGIIEVATNIPEAEFELTGPENRSGVGLFESWPEMPPGTYLVTFTPIPGYTTPVPQTLTLFVGTTNSIRVEYGLIPGFGTVSVATDNPAAAFDIIGPAERSGIGMSESWSDMPVGSYTATFHPIPGFNTPEPQTIILTADETIVFDVIYTVYVPSGTIEIVTNRPDAPFDLTGPENHSGVGNTTFSDMPLGDYIVTFYELPGFITPDSQEKTLAIDGGILTFNGVYGISAGFGAITIITNNEAATFELTGFNSRTGSGTLETWDSLPIGDYTITFNEIPGHTTPAPRNISLTSGSSVTFNVEYEPEYGTIVVQTNLKNGVTFTITSPEYTQADFTFVDAADQRTWTLEDAFSGDHTIAFGAVDGYDTPESETLTLVKDGTITFVGEYIHHAGTIVVQTNLKDEAAFTITSPGYTEADFTFEDTETQRIWTLPNAFTGKHTIAFGAVNGYDTPESEIQTLVKDGTITFIGEYIRQTGTIVVQTNLKDGVNFSVNSSEYTEADFAFEDTADQRIWTLQNVPTDEYIIVFGVVSNYSKPASETLTLLKDETITFTGEYTHDKGAIVVQTNLKDEATFALTDSGYTQIDFTFVDSASQRIWTLLNAPTGDHTITFGNVSNYTTPASETLTLIKGGTITFTGEYTPIPPTISSLDVSGSPAKLGDIVAVLMSADAGYPAVFSIEGIISDKPMTESVSFPGVYTGQYVVQAGDNATDAVISVEVTGIAGTTAVDESGRATIDTTPPVIDSVSVSGSPVHHIGNAVTVTMKGEADGTAQFSIPGAAESVDMTEIEPGTYEGSYAAIDDLELDGVDVVVSLSDAAGNTIINRSQTVSICTLRWDLNKDGLVDTQDIKIIGENLGKTSTPELDLNEDGIIDMLDLLIIAIHYGERCGFEEAMLAAAPFAPYTVPNYLFQNYPNPCNPGTWIPYMLAEGQEVTINIYNPSGQLIRRLDMGYREPGIYVNKEHGAYWDGSNEYGEEAVSGIYFYHIQAGKFSAVRKMLVAK